MSELRLHNMNIISKEELITLNQRNEDLVNSYWAWWRFAGDGGWWRSGRRVEWEVGRRGGGWVIGVH
jgi:hypothetical protein